MSRNLLGWRSAGRLSARNVFPHSAVHRTPNVVGNRIVNDKTNAAHRATLADGRHFDFAGSFLLVIPTTRQAKMRIALLRRWEPEKFDPRLNGPGARWCE